MQWCVKYHVILSGIIVDMGLANERRHYFVTFSLIGRAYTQNDPCLYMQIFFKESRFH